MVNVVLVISLIFALIVAIFAVQNNIPVDIAFLGWKYSGISLVLVILGSAVAGAVAVFLFGLVRQLRLQMDLRSAKSQNEKLSSQILSLEDKIAVAESASVAKEGANGPTAGGSAALGESLAEQCHHETKTTSS